MRGSATPGLRWDIEVGDSTVLVRVAGELDMARCLPLQTALVDAVDGRREMIVDLSGLEFMDSSGVRCLLTVKAAAEEAGTALILGDVSPVVERVLDVSGTLPLLRGEVN